MTEVQSFVGIVNFTDVPSKISHMLPNPPSLSKKGEGWQWTEEEQGSFEELKHIITSTPI